jgi:predicted acyltransferase
VNPSVAVGEVEGWSASVPTSAGCFAGQLPRSHAGDGSKVNWLIAAGALALAAGWFWGYSFPVIKNRWTSTFVLFAAGWSCLLLAGFYLVVDVWKYRASTFPFQVIGSNSIVAYLSGNVFHDLFVSPGSVLFGNLVPALGTFGEPMLQLSRVLSIFGFLWLSRRANLFVRI